MRKHRQGRRPYRVETLLEKRRTEKGEKLDHPSKRLKQRTGQPQSALDDLRARLKEVKLPGGTHHTRMHQGDGYAVIKDVGKARPHHVVATVLDRHAKYLPGMDVGSYLHKRASAAMASSLEFAKLAFFSLRKKNPVEALEKEFLAEEMPEEFKGKASTPRNKRYLAELLANPLNPPSTPFSDLIYGRRFPEAGVKRT